MDGPCTAKAHLLPADGSPIKMVIYNIKERDNEDMVDSGMTEFFHPIPDLKARFGNGYQQPAMAAFYVDIKEKHHTNHWALDWRRVTQSFLTHPYSPLIEELDSRPALRRVLCLMAAIMPGDQHSEHDESYACYGYIPSCSPTSTHT